MTEFFEGAFKTLADGNEPRYYCLGNLGWGAMALTSKDQEKMLSKVRITKTWSRADLDKINEGKKCSEVPATGPVKRLKMETGTPDFKRFNAKMFLQIENTEGTTGDITSVQKRIDNAITTYALMRQLLERERGSISFLTYKTYGLVDYGTNNIPFHDRNFTLIINNRNNERKEPNISIYGNIDDSESRVVAYARYPSNLKHIAKPMEFQRLKLEAVRAQH